MLMSEFIERCQDLKNEYGDLEVEDDAGRIIDIEYYEGDDEFSPCFVVE